ncbi:5'-3' nuclease (nurA) [Thermococcus sp. 4557]|uniref:DNA double-strand break repair nuclease NurA n=1 Tax=Thermococcus sp. (strain CGMCC 1.5172 / 4557) TaxID=1042877 RepID=UPI000219E32B|nr:DNA double-strand break repair nuclease NurA [Thermococcus sp. 4557]AEK71955.1 5'-3' nuclease (nurA) [Thermococcus sp. 4557]
MERISDVHIKEIRNFLLRSLRDVGKLRSAVAKHFSWKPLPAPRGGNVYAIDGSRMMKRLSGAIIYAVSASAIGERLYYWNDIGMVFPYKNVEERVRIHMDILEKRMGAMMLELGADLVLMDGTISSAIITPPTYASSTTRELYNRHGKQLLEAALEFLDFLDEQWVEWREELEKTGVLNGFSLPSRGWNGEEIFSMLMKRGARSIRESFWWVNDKEDLIVLFEYLEYLHALDRLLGGRIAAVAKTFYKSDVVKTVLEREKEKLKGAPMIVDTPVVASLSDESGYLEFRYLEKPKEAFPKLVVDLMHHGKLQSLKEILIMKDGKILGARIRPAYVRFAERGLIYLLEVPERQDFEGTLANILSVAEDEYVIPLEYAHHSVVIKKQEFDAYVSAVLSALVGEDERFLSFLRYGREPLE